MAVPAALRVHTYPGSQSCLSNYISMLSGPWMKSTKPLRRSCTRQRAHRLTCGNRRAGPIGLRPFRFSRRRKVRRRPSSETTRLGSNPPPDRMIYRAVRSTGFLPFPRIFRFSFGRTALEKTFEPRIMAIRELRDASNNCFRAKAGRAIMQALPIRYSALPSPLKRSPKSNISSVSSPS